MLDTIHDELYNSALAERDARIKNVDKWEDFTPSLNKGNLNLIPFCGQKECEEKIKDKSKEESEAEETVGGLKMGAKSLCVPIEDKYNCNCPPTCIFPGCVHAEPVARRTLF